MINGIINVYKEKGYTSHDVVAKLRGIFGQKKIGHTGTLDPDAEGVLPVCLGKATKACDLLADKDKEYETVLLLGTVTDTQDITGTIMQKTKADVGEDQIRKIIQGFIGDCEQMPPMYSALKVNGRKLCDLARAGVTVERKPRRIQIYDIDVINVALPEVRMRVHCSKGTYIRTLCHDIGAAAGCGGCMKSLVRTRVSQFLLQDAHKLSELQERVGEFYKRNPGRELAKEDFKDLIKDTDSVFLQYPMLTVKKEFSRLLHNGNPLRREWTDGWKNAYENTVLRIYDEKQAFAGIYQWKESSGDIRPIKIFME